MKTMPMSMAMLLLAGCAPTQRVPVTPASVSSAPAVHANSLPAPKPVVEAEPASMTEPGKPATELTGASISGAIRDGNRPPPALRVCATPVDGGAPTCIETAEGAREYRIELTPGSYYLLGWVQSGDLKLIAHALQIRCIRAPCPPDSLIKVSVAAGQELGGIDLNGGYGEIPADWPKRPK